MSPPPIQQAKQIVGQAAQKYGIPAPILWGVYGTESSFGRNLGPSSAGAVGPFQFEPGTAQSLGINPHDFTQAAFGAAKYLSQFKGRGLAGMLSAYNAGPGGALQPSYVQSVLNNAKSYGGGGSAASLGQMPTLTQTPSHYAVNTASVSYPSTVLNQQGFQNAEKAYALGNYLSQTAHNNPFGNMGGSQGLSQLFAAGKASTSPPDPAAFQSTKMFQIAQSSLQKVAGTTTLSAHPAVMKGSSSVGGGFLPQGAKYTQERQDQGRDGITNPGGAIIAPGNGYVVRVGSDPNGFGPAYPIIHLTSGPYAGRTMYIGHTLSVVKPGQKFQAGQVLSHTGTHGVGNATVPGWFEIGFADSGTPGPFGQPAPF